MLLNPGLNLQQHRSVFEQQGHHQIRGFLVPSTAKELYHCLNEEVEWSLAWYDHERHAKSSMTHQNYHAMTNEQRQRFLGKLARDSVNRYGFAYDHYPMVRAHLEKWDTEHRLHRLIEELNSESFLDVARRLTGLDEIRRISAQATRYSTGHFLRLHTDDVPEEERLVAYMLNLTPTWNVDFGGLLHFVGNHGGVESIYFPWFNSFSFFRVPRWHFVSMVMPWASSDRLAITGWFRR